jgi:hypothetical protein
MITFTPVHIATVFVLLNGVDSLAVSTAAASRSPTSFSLAPPPTTTPAPTPQLRATKTITSSSTFTLFYLNVTSAAPDFLGIAKVSSLYGPRTWSAWFLFIVASWLRIIIQPEDKVDFNTCSFLLGVNRAAVDVFRGPRALRAVRDGSPVAEFATHMGKFGAGMTVLFWG